MNKRLKPLLTFVLLLHVCVGKTVFAEVTEVDNDALQKLLAQGVAVIDVRRVDEWQNTGVIQGVHLLTFFDEQGRYDAKKWLAELKKIAPDDAPVVLICERGVRSKTIARLLDKRLGMAGIHNHSRGMAAWRAQGRPVVPVASPVEQQ